MSQPNPERTVSCTALAVPPIVLLLVGVGDWYFADFKANSPWPTSRSMVMFAPYFFVLFLVGLLVAPLSAGLLRVLFPRNRDPRGGQFFLSVILTSLLVLSYCAWGNLLVEFSYWLGI